MFQIICGFLLWDWNCFFIIVPYEMIIYVLYLTIYKTISTNAIKFRAAENNCFLIVVFTSYHFNAVAFRIQLNSDATVIIAICTQNTNSLYSHKVIKMQEILILNSDLSVLEVNLPLKSLKNNEYWKIVNETILNISNRFEANIIIK